MTLYLDPSLQPNLIPLPIPLSLPISHSYPQSHSSRSSQSPILRPPTTPTTPTTPIPLSDPTPSSSPSLGNGIAHPFLLPLSLSLPPPPLSPSSSAASTSSHHYISLAPLTPPILSPLDFQKLLGPPPMSPSCASPVHPQAPPSGPLTPLVLAQSQAMAQSSPLPPSTPTQQGHPSTHHTLAYSFAGPPPNTPLSAATTPGGSAIVAGPSASAGAGTTATVTTTATASEGFSPGGMSSMRPTVGYQSQVLANGDDNSKGDSLASSSVAVEAAAAAAAAVAYSYVPRFDHQPRHMLPEMLNYPYPSYVYPPTTHSASATPAPGSASAPSPSPTASPHVRAALYHPQTGYQHQHPQPMYPFNFQRPPNSYYPLHYTAYGGGSPVTPPATAHQLYVTQPLPQPGQSPHAHHAYHFAPPAYQYATTIDVAPTVQSTVPPSAFSMWHIPQNTPLERDVYPPTPSGGDRLTARRASSVSAELVRVEYDQGQRWETAGHAVPVGVGVGAAGEVEGGGGGSVGGDGEGGQVSPNPRSEDEQQPVIGIYRNIEVCYTSDAERKLTNQLRRLCHNCRDTKQGITWRKSNLYPGKILCNKCGIYERTHHRARPLQNDDHKLRKATAAAAAAAAHSRHGAQLISLGYVHGHGHGYGRGHGHIQRHGHRGGHFTHPPPQPLIDHEELSSNEGDHSPFSSLPTHTPDTATFYEQAQQQQQHLQQQQLIHHELYGPATPISVMAAYATAPTLVSTPASAGAGGDIVHSPHVHTPPHSSQGHGQEITATPLRSISATSSSTGPVRTSRAQERSHERSLRANPYAFGPAQHGYGTRRAGRAVTSPEPSSERWIDAPRPVRDDDGEYAP